MIRVEQRGARRRVADLEQVLEVEAEGEQRDGEMAITGRREPLGADDPRSIRRRPDRRRRRRRSVERAIAKPTSPYRAAAGRMQVDDETRERHAEQSPRPASRNVVVEPEEPTDGTIIIHT